MKKKIILLALFVTMLISASMPEVAFAAKEFEFTVYNYTNKAVTVKLDGNVDYEVTVARGDKETISVRKGEYAYEYFACNETWDDTITVAKDYKLIIYACDTVPTKMRVNSHLSEDIVLEMIGPDDYKFNIELGSNRIELFSGYYTYSYEACDKQIFTGEIRVTKNGNSEITLHSCEWHLHPARTYAKPVPVKFRIVNMASFPITLQLTGPEGYLMTLNPGVNIFILVYGNYKYTYYLDYQYHAGFVSVPQNGAGQLILKPEHIFIRPDQLEGDAE